MKKLSLLFSAVLMFSVISCDVKKTEDGDMPSVDVDVEASSGELPEYKVDWASVEVKTRTETIRVPKVKVVMEEEEVEVPYVDVDGPNSGEKEERTILAEAEVSGEMQKIQIQKIYASDDNLYVISMLENTGEKLENETVRISDRVYLNVPSDLDVRHYIVGKKGDSDFNRSYRYLDNENDLSDKLEGAKLIYSRK